ncbi:DNA-binding protein [Bradyrhizobium sp. CB82]|uniref:DNA-binding protein n=1 Tax=Bradyrhizobium sp. CB82 TaxID=3039159 RepID=UPI0024B13FAA|nr:DNA-binding protein [Bradyrhizobium sp. CB82]WFU37316.1 DNA-binding protein [Bradyrhizobium sp. CB82]
MSAQNDTAAPNIIWGAKAISQVIRRPEKSTFNALEAGKIPGAKKIGGRWGLNPSVFFAAFEAA